MKVLKSLYMRRSRYGWLAAEIMVAAAIAFFVLDPIIVSIYDASRPYNYDIDRLVMVYMRPYDSHHPKYHGDENYVEELERDIYLTAPKLTQIQGVERAIPLPERGFGSGKDSYDSLILPDSTSIKGFKATYIPNTGFFSTFGFKAAEGVVGNPTIEQMDSMHVDFYSQAIVTRTFAKLIYGDVENVIQESRRQQEEDERNGIWRSKRRLRVVGVIEDARAWGDRPWPIIRFYSDPLSHSLTWSETNLVRIVLKLKEGESAEAVARRLNGDKDLQALCTSGNFEFERAKPYREVNGADSVLSPKERYRNILVIFFAINIFLGVFGTFWLLTRKRTEEAGIMRAFGASALKVRLMLYCEGAIMAVGASVLGCAGCVYYVMQNPERLERGLGATPAVDGSDVPAELLTWVSDFWVHCSVVSAVVIVMILVIVLLGIAIPARYLSRINPVDALRDE